jgi:hypothetical protein
MAFYEIKIRPNRNRTFLDKLASNLMPKRPAYAYARIPVDRVTISAPEKGANVSLFFGLFGSGNSAKKEASKLLKQDGGLKKFLDKIKSGEIDLDKISTEHLTKLAVLAAEKDIDQLLPDVMIFRRIGDKGMAKVATVMFEKSPTMLANNIRQLGIKNLFILQKMVIAVASEKPDKTDLMLNYFFEKLDEFLKKNERLDTRSNIPHIQYNQIALTIFKTLKMDDFFMELTELVPGLASEYINRSNIADLKKRADIAMADAEKNGVAVARHWKNYNISAHPEDKKMCELVSGIMLKAYEQDPAGVGPYLDNFGLQVNLIPGLQKKLDRIHKRQD